ncbi:spore germination protein [Paenibacillus eucommiae]|uniref:Spore germination protein KA n=1 Tax=Paenibacillus eucommiae TaxID=1355755 RepID=A0ABS4IXG0_9BACL|nr:spore germination protein [Paenibacillus eucommiae]MBP1992235.1 spore germination protein KA [Paenibacillus eucommiae]
MKFSRKKAHANVLPVHDDAESPQLVQIEFLKASLQENIQHIKEVLGNSGDIVIREIRIGSERQLQAALFYTEGLVDTKSVHEYIMETLMSGIEFTGPNLLQDMKDCILTVGDIQEVSEFVTLFTSLLSGDVILLLDGYTQGFMIGMSGWESRSVSEPATESVVRGPRESFTENLQTNTALIRRKIKDPNLWLERKQIGRVTKTKVAVMYIHGIVNDKIVEEVHKRLDRIDMDGILESGYVEELIQDETYTPFPTIYNSERPDVIAAELLEGKIAILVDGTPFVLIVPALFISFFHSMEDYFQRADISSFIRILRFFGFLIALLGPSIYIAITTFHQEMLPTQLLIGLAAQREGVPFPAFIEAFMMEVAFEILREAGLRMPRTIGQAVSIVGTLVIGQAAVEAGIVSAAMVIVVSITAISGFVFPASNMSMATRMLRFPLMGLAASFGLFGIIIGVIGLVLHLCSLRSFGVPYMSPFAPIVVDDLKDTVFRFPHWAMSSRPKLISQKNLRRARNTSPKPDNRT